MTPLGPNFRQTFIAVLLVATMCVLPCSAAEPPAALEAIIANGSTFRAALVGIDASWMIHFGGAKSRNLPAAQLVTWGQFFDPRSGPNPSAWVVLVNGGLIVADVLDLDKQKLRIDSDVFGELRLPVDALAGILFRPPADRGAADQAIDRLLATTADVDRVLLENGDELTGVLTGLHDKALAIESSVGRVDVKLDNAVSLAFNPALTKRHKLTGLRAWIGFRDGSRVLAAAADSRDKRTTFKLPGDIELTAATSEVVALQPLGDDVVYLSDLKAASYRHVPFLTIEWPYRVDHSVGDHQLRAGGRPALKGLGMHSPARLTYDFDQTYRQFQAELAIDDEVGQRGSATFRVLVDDGDGKWKSRYASPVVRGGEPPRPIVVDLSGAKRISLLVDYAERGDELDHADWLNARLVK